MWVAGLMAIIALIGTAFTGNMGWIHSTTGSIIALVVIVPIIVLVAMANKKPKSTVMFDKDRDARIEKIERINKIR